MFLKMKYCENLMFLKIAGLGADYKVFIAFHEMLPVEAIEG